MSKKKPILLVTSNAHKKQEFQAMFAHTNYTIIGLDDIGFDGAIEENFDTYKDNAIAKVEALADVYDGIIIADDSGFEVAALNFQPGVHSARFKPELTYAEKNQLIINAIKDQSDRSCAFVCAIACLKDDLMWVSVNHALGKVADQVIQGHGFGYDPIFIPLGYDQPFSLLDPSIKNKISHRALAINALLEYFEQTETNQ